MLTDDDVTGLQLALEQGDAGQVRHLVESESGEELTGLQLFADHTLLMYACEKATPEIVRLLLDKGTQVEELEWSTNNELKSTLRNEKYRNEILPLVLGVVPDELRAEMITTDWDPEGLDQGRAVSPLQMAENLDDKTCHRLLSAG